MHIKIKHNGGNKTEREKLAKSLVYAKANGLQISDNLDVNLAPGSIMRAAEEVGVKIEKEMLMKLENDLQTANEKSILQQKQIELMKAKQMGNAGIIQKKIKSVEDKQVQLVSKDSTTSQKDNS